VLFAATEPRQFGNLVVVDHGGGLQTAYAFLSRITVKEGDDVSLGERVGLSGHTGKARGPELHFEVRRNNRPVDPAPLLQPRS
jgi:murein DD-endopeptidase MepM/ murein hydrolase activator NlpD